MEGIKKAFELLYAFEVPEVLYSYSAKSHR